VVSGRILIVGGGIAGLTLHRALRGGPWQLELVERGTRPGRLGAGLAVQPNALRALHGLGVAAAVEKAGAVIHRFRYLDQTGTLLCDIDLDDLWGDVGPFVGITRAALHEALLSESARRGMGRAVSSVRQHDGRVSVTFDDGTADAYDLVIGADGINSGVRRSAASSSAARRSRPAYTGQMVWRSVAPVCPGGLDGVQFWLGRDRFFGLCPVGDGITYGFGNLTCARVQDPVAGRRRRLIGRFGGFGTPVQEYLAGIQRDSDIHCAPVEWLPETAWRNGRVVLIGDAAHAMSPMMGQGGCMAIEDACVLAEELGRGSDIPAALTAFAERRQPRVSWVREQSQALTELVGLPAEVRDRALREHGTSAFYDRYRPLTDMP
jgi:2-polyprenyl-6-methoxyphenol hydroxylase-like FAD-dependent oxidoreductase